MEETKVRQKFTSSVDEDAQSVYKGSPSTASQLPRTTETMDTYLVADGSKGNVIVKVAESEGHQLQNGTCIPSSIRLGFSTMRLKKKQWVLSIFGHF